MPKTIGVRELKSQASRILRSVREDMVEYVVTVRDEPVAVLRPYTEEDELRLRQDEIMKELAELEALAEEVAKAWISPKSGVELIDEQRRYRCQLSMPVVT